MELEGSPDEVLAKLQAIETLKQLMRTRPAVERDAVIDAAARAQVEKLAGRWRCVNNGWPPVIDTEMSIVDLERGIISDHVEAMGQTSERQIKIYEVMGSTLKVQTLDSQEISEWRMVSDDTIEMGVATRETVLVFNRQ